VLVFWHHSNANAVGNIPCHTVHCFKDIALFGIVFAGKDMSLVGGLDQLHVYRNLIAAAADAAFHNVIQPELTPDAGHALFAALVMHGCGAGNHCQMIRRELAKSGDDLVRHRIAEVLLSRVTAHIR
jgi:hypothetical protein